MKIQFVPCSTGDMIHIQSEEGINILVDSGFKKQCKEDLVPLLDSLDSVALWIITHTDKDHIGGITKLLEQNKTKDLLSEKVKEVWFNYSPASLSPDTNEICYNQGILVRDALSELGLLKTDDITINTKPVQLTEHLSITLLSPTEDQLERFKNEWKGFEKDRNVASGKDHHIASEKLLANEFAEDTEVANGASIAFMLENTEKKVLFLGDAHPSTIEQTLISEGYTTDRKIKIDCVKVSHHGSKKSTSPGLLDLIDCHTWVFTATGSKPHKETLLRIADHYKDSQTKTMFYINHEKPTYETIFRKEPHLCEELNFEIINLPDGILDI